MLISQPPAAIPLVEARLFIVTPFDEVRRNHELVILLLKSGFSGNIAR